MLQIQQYVDSFLNQTFDCIAVLLMIQVLQGFRTVMQNRNISVLTTYFDECVSKLWSRFKSIFDKNLESVQTAVPQQLVATEKVSPAIAKRYAELASSIHALNKDPNVREIVVHVICLILFFSCIILVSIIVPKKSRT